MLTAARLRRAASLVLARSRPLPLPARRAAVHIAAAIPHALRAPTTMKASMPVTRNMSSAAAPQASPPSDAPNSQGNAEASPLPQYDPSDLNRLDRLRNIGISAHIDSGKTTLTERILFYTGRIDEIHEVRGKDNVGAKMDSMELEREKGITIQSAATYTKWGDHAINIIDTPGHVDFTIEVERALRVLDGAVLVLCAVGGVQSQTITVDRQMKRYSVPRICFINKMDRAGANPFRVIEQLRSKLNINATPVQIPIGAETNLQGVVDLVRMKAYYHEGDNGEKIITRDVPAELLERAQDMRAQLVENLANVDEAIGEIYLNEETPTTEQLLQAIRRQTIARTFVPVFMGSAYHNRGVQPLLDGVTDYLPAPHQVCNSALDTTTKEEREFMLSSASSFPFVALAFKLEEGRFGQLTYLRVYQGTLSRGDYIVNARTSKRVKVSRLVRMHSNEMEDVNSVGSGEICALFGVECASGDTFTDGQTQCSMTSMYVPKPVISLSITPKAKDSGNFSKALNRFQREDPTFRVHMDSESKQTIISGMGELHLEIYVERMRREYNVECVTGKPQVAFRETMLGRAEFDFTHKKQSGGAGQFARVIGYIEPIPEDEELDDEDSGRVRGNGSHDNDMRIQFDDQTVGMNIPHQYIPAIEKGFREACEKGWLIGHPITGVRMVLKDGAAHSVDSSELAFRIASIVAFRDAFTRCNPIVLEPIMEVSLTSPVEYQGACIALLNRRKGVIADTVIHNDMLEVTADVPLNDMFGFSTDLRSATQGKAEFSMTYKEHQAVLPPVQEMLVKEFTRLNQAK